MSTRQGFGTASVGRGAGAVGAAAAALALALTALSASAEYALFWATPAAVVAGLVITITVELAGSIDPLVLLVVGAALILCIPAATILNLGLRKQKAGRRRARIGDVQWFVIIAGICVLMLVAATAGFDLWRAVSVNE